MTIGKEMYQWATDLYPICRSITGDGVRQTLEYLKANAMPDMDIVEVPSGTPAFDWTVPDEWNIRDAYILDSSGCKVVDFRQSNLHVVGYSEPVDRLLDLKELQEHLHSLPQQPTAIPYVTSYYRRTWGFCLTDHDRQRLRPGKYRAVIDSTLAPGCLSYGELVLPGQETAEILLSTYMCHPSMANNELSGPVVAAALARWLTSVLPRRYTYRIVFAPETIGSLVYLSRHLSAMKQNTIAGFVLTCVGDERAWSFVPSRLGGTLADRVALHCLEHYAPQFRSFSFLERGADERQYCSARIDLPVVSMMRSKATTYPEYHTSLDDLTVISPRGLQESFCMLSRIVVALERNERYRATCYGEPQMGRRGLYPLFSTKESLAAVRVMMHLLAYADGDHDLLQIAARLGLPVDSLYEPLEVLKKAELVEKWG